MVNFPGNSNISDTLAFRAAVEAVIGLTLQGERPDVKNVRAWLDMRSNQTSRHAKRSAVRCISLTA
jgi:hypothetical protein